MDFFMSSVNELRTTACPPKRSISQFLSRCFYRYPLKRSLESFLVLRHKHIYWCMLITFKLLTLASWTLFYLNTRVSGNSFCITDKLFWSTGDSEQEYKLCYVVKTQHPDYGDSKPEPCYDVRLVCGKRKLQLAQESKLHRPIYAKGSKLSALLIVDHIHFFNIHVDVASISLPENELLA